jgi:glycosyltransferase involved in cell wall biosynthesis
MMKRRVAIIAGTSFPPIASASVHRVLAWLRYLPGCGWEPEVFTLPVDYRPEKELDRSLLSVVPNDSRVRRVAPIWHRRIPRSWTVNTEVRASEVTGQPIGWRAASFVKDALLIPDTRILWAPPAVASLAAIHRKSRFAAVLSTSQQNSSHVAGLLASSFLHLPWVADFQDPWRSPWLSPKLSLQGRVDGALARAVLRRSDAITVISTNVGRSLEEGYQAPASKIELIPNGFEPSTADPKKRREARNRFTIVHTGSFYGRRTPAQFLRAVDTVVALHPQIEGHLVVRFIGSFDEASAAAIAPYASRAWLEIVKPVPHADSLRAQADADLLLLIPGEESMSMPGKIYEYLSTGRPLLCLASDDSDAATLLRDLKAGSIVSPDDSAALERHLLASIGRDRPEQDVVPLAGLNHRYHWPDIVARMGEVLERVAM